MKKNIPKLETIVCGLLWYIWSEYRKSGERLEPLEGYEGELEAAYQEGDKKRFNEIVKKALEENHG